MMPRRIPTNFKELKLNVGDSIGLESVSTKSRYPVKLIGYLEGQSIIVTVPRINGKEFLIKEGTSLRVRMIADNYACGFQTRVLSYQTSPFLHFHLEYPSKLEAVAVRQASRVRLALPVSIDEVDKGELIGEWPRNEVLVDVSNTGARIQCTEGLAPVGSDLNIKFTVTVDGISRNLKVRSVVRNIAEVTDPDRGEVFQYGLQFQPLSDDDRVYICGYVYEQMLYQDGAANVAISK